MSKESNSKSQFVVCIVNNDCEGLELRKIYECLPDEKAAEDNHIRVVDESGEDYLYPSSYFYPIELPQVVQEIFRITS